MNRLEFLDFLTLHEKKAEITAEKRLKQRKYMMYGYWKAIAVHLRRMKREFKKIN